VAVPRLDPPQLRDEAIDEVPSEPIPKAYVEFVRNLDWFLSFMSFTALWFVALSQTMAVFVFLIGGALLAFVAPVRALRAMFGDWLPWLYAAVILVSVSWSPVPELSGRFAVQTVITFIIALIIARAIPPHSFLSALMCSIIVIDIVGLFLGRYALNAGAMAMIGAFGSKNAFSATQAILLMVSWWVLLSVHQNAWMRSLALLSVFVCPFLLIAGRSADSTTPAVLALGFTLLAYSTSWLPPLSRTLTFCAGASVMVCIFGIAFIFSDTLFGQALIITGKDVTLSGRTYLWQRASELMRESPLLGWGYGGFWVQGNPYAEAIWDHFQLTGRGGFHFHSLWYEMGVDLGYIGIVMAFVALLTVAIRAFRWTVRAPSAESYFFLGYVMTVCMRSILEVELFSQFSISMILFIAAGYYARNEDRNVSTRSDVRPILQAPS
jgi:exopolysaccharide production protein ExoQ